MFIKAVCYQRKYQLIKSQLLVYTAAAWAQLDSLIKDQTVIDLG